MTNCFLKFHIHNSYYLAAPPVSLPFVCDFENDLCGMTQPEKGLDWIDWYRFIGRPPNPTYGPSAASHGDWYIYREGNRPRQAGDTAM